MTLILALLASCGLRGDPDLQPAADPIDEMAEKARYEERRREIMGDLRTLVDDLEAEGRYDCCVKVPCSHCALLVGGCSCGEGLRRGEPVCEECAYLWTRGQGAEPVDPSTVTSFLEANRPPKACACPAPTEE